MAEPASPGHRLDGIDVMRALAALGVFLFHLNIGLPADTPGLLGAWRWVWQHGHLGVPVFFVVSGLCIGLSWQRAPGAFAFVRARARRIFPPYWTSLGLIALVALAARLLTGVNCVATFPRTPGAIAATGLLFTAPLSSVPALSGVYWSLSCEIVFYLIMGGLLLVRPAHRLTTLVAWHALACGATLVDLPAGGWATPLHLWPLFGTGLALALRDRAPLVAGTLLGLSALHAGLHFLRGSLTDYWCAASVAILGLVLFAGLRSLRWPRLLVGLGTISYSVYIIHWTIADPVLGRLLRPSADLPGLEFGRQFVVLTVTLAACALFYRWFEKPWIGRPVALAPFVPSAAATTPRS